MTLTLEDFTTAQKRKIAFASAVMKHQPSVTATRNLICLVSIDLQPGIVSSELSRILNIEYPGLASIVQALRKKGYIYTKFEKKNPKTNRPMRQHFLTDKGFEFMLSAFPEEGGKA